MVMIKANVFEVKAKLSEYLDRAAGGERIVICRHNIPVAELRAVESTRTEPRPIGPLPGEPTFEVPPSFFEPLPDDELELWDGITPEDPPRRASKVAEAKASSPVRKRTRARRRP
jgi:antitoxin (DNA-binding transcriptional repressor) of toxin-antitoxin stability system